MEIIKNGYWSAKKGTQKMKRYTIEQIENIRMTKGDLFKELENIGKTFDYALPQQWLNNFSKFAAWNDLTYDLIRSTTVWIYPENKPVSICSEVQAEIDKFMKY
jgi:hypothetical protein